MNKLILSILIYSTVLCAKEKTSNSIISENPPDTLKISELVEKQIVSAKEKQLLLQLSKDNNVYKPILVKEKLKIDQVHNTSVNSFIQNQPLHIQLFGLCAIAVILFVLIRRLGFILKRRSKQAQKDKIQMLREEKIKSSPQPKLQFSRRSLRNSELVLKGSEKHISRTAKDLKISKGELVLAARLKLFEVGKM
jgi:hypothetical protein